MSDYIEGFDAGVSFANTEAQQIDVDWDDVYMEAEANGEGEARAMVRYAYKAGYEAGLAKRKLP